ncbi:hypothetical protein F383_38867 [Gossypium arboreum]|uniref:Uncharacterized protein n=1 Tax=Gossypium arboreum TaxID=29729 RepID=A0A0B0MIL0_GOSAR|nr:hypothetical protein F383_38867 [Gossypium arboreum]
MGQSTNST